MLTQELDYTTGPLDYAILQRSLGATTPAHWFPPVPANTATPYDTGPYLKEPLTPVAADARQQRASRAAADRVGDGSVGRARARGAFRCRRSGHRGGGPTAGRARPAARRPDPRVPRQQRLGGERGQGRRRRRASRRRPASAADAAVDLVRGGPVSARVPGRGGVAAGRARVLLGHNAHIAWSLTDTQNSATLYYAEQVRGDEYYWRGGWRTMTVEHYTIPVRGGATVHLAVDITVHGPIMTQVGQKMAVDWMGNVPSDDLGALIGVNQASDWTQFKAALAGGGRRPRTSPTPTMTRVTGKAAARADRKHRRLRGPLLPAGGQRLPAVAADVRGRRSATSPVSSPTTRSRRSTTRRRTWWRPTTSARSRPTTRITSAPATTSTTRATGPPTPTRRSARPTASAASIAGLQNNLDRSAWRPRSCRNCWPPLKLGRSHPGRTLGRVRPQLVERLDERRIVGGDDLVDVLVGLPVGGVRAVVEGRARAGRQGQRQTWP